jgi:signal transduction histidine kinase
MTETARRSCIVSDDSEVVALYRGLLAELFRCDWSVDVNPQDGPAAYDLCIWDFHPESARPGGKDFGVDVQKCFFVIDREYLGEFSRAVGPAPFILLRPVTRPALRAFLEEFHARFGEARATSDGERDLSQQRDEILQCLIHANLKLQQNDQERANFVARAVHDFRVPLTAVTGYCGLLLAGRLGPITEEQREVLERQQRSTKRLSRAATAMLELSTRQRVWRAVNFEPGDLRESLEQALHETALAAEEKQITIAVEVEPCAGTLRFECSQLEQVFLNLLDNAIRFTPRYGTIVNRGYPDFWERRLRPFSPGVADRRVATRREPNCFRFDIQDSGCGIPTDHLTKIFEEYASYSNGQDRSGGGLGLAISKCIVERHQGRIWARSDASGAVFSFVLPFQETSTATHPVRLETVKPFFAGVV